MADTTCVLSVFFEGTANTLDPTTTQIGIFAKASSALDITERAGPISPSEGPFKMAFDGCGVTNGCLGVLFAAGLTSQCRKVVQKIDELLDAHPGRLRCNALGLSRGGLALFILARRLASHERVDLSMCIFDPVPGTMVSTGFPCTGSGMEDLSGCRSLRKVLAIYPHEPLPDVALHAPMLGIYPQGCAVEEDVTLGCHQAALFRTRTVPQHTYYDSGARSKKGRISTVDAASNLSFHRIMHFLTAVGTDVDISRAYAGPYVEPTADDCLRIYRATLTYDQPTRRITHDARGRLIVRRPLCSAPLFVNRHHEALEGMASADPRKGVGWREGSDDSDSASMIATGFPTRHLLDFEDPAPRHWLRRLMCCHCCWSK